MQIEELAAKQRAYFRSGKTLDVEGRIRALELLEQVILKYEEKIYGALEADLGKSRSESYMCEVGMTLSELRYIRRHVRSWSRNRRVRTPLAQFHARSFTVQEPYGVVLIMSPWNYPVLLTLDPLDHPAYGKMINQKHFERVTGLIDEEKLVHGGKMDAETFRLEPTILDRVTEDDAVMQEEIFGPILPVLTVESMDEAYAFVKDRPQPLALYLFTADTKTETRFLKEVPFGGGCVNDTVIHLATFRMGFGGVGSSGMGSYHGRKSLETFSHEKSIVKKYNWIDPPMRYQPHTKWKDQLIRMFLR